MFESTTPTQEQTPSSFETWLSLEVTKQYESQIRTLDRLGLLQILPESGRYGILDISGVERPLPEREDIKQEMLKKRDFYCKKWEQGFTKLQITPFGLPLSTLIERAKQTILKRHAAGVLFQTKKNQDDLSEALVPVDLDPNNPIYVWEGLDGADEKETLVYDPKQFTSEGHGGRTKKQILNEQETGPFSGFLVSFYEPSVNIPRQGKGQTVGGRKQLETNQTPKEYLKQREGDVMYQGEAGERPEEWLTRMMTHLAETDQIIDDWQGNGSANFLIGSWVPASGGVPCAYFNRDNRRAYLAGDDPESRSGSSGCRSAVRV